MGSEANLYCDRGRYELWSERGTGVEDRKRVDTQHELIGLDFYEEVDGAFYHLQDWVDCVRTRRRPTCPAEEGVRSAAAAHFSNFSYRNGKSANWSELG